MGHPTARAVNHDATVGLDLAGILDGLADAVIVADATGTIRYANSAAERLLGWTAAELVGRPLGTIQPPHLRDACLAGLRRYQSSGHSDLIGQTVRLPALRRDGTEIDVDLALAAIGEPALDGRLLFVATLRQPAAATPNERTLIELLARETHAREAAEAARRRSEFLGEATALLAGSLNVEETMATLTRLAVPSLADWCFVDVVDEDETIRPGPVACADPATAKALRRLHRRYPLTWDSPRPQGRVLRSRQSLLLPAMAGEWLAANVEDLELARLIEALRVTSAMVVPLVARGRTVGVISFAATAPRPPFETGDLTLAEEIAGNAALAIDNARLFQEQVRARARIQELAAERSAVLGQIADGVIIADADGRLVFVNEAAARLHGVDSLGVPIDQYTETYHLFTMDGRPYPPAELPLARAVLAGETVMNAEWRIRRPDGTETVAEGSATPVIADDGTRLGAVLTLRDVTANREFERSKIDFIATASHDLKTPLTTIKGWAQLMLQRAQPEPDRIRDVAALTAIVAQANTMQRLIDQLLDASRLQLGQEQPLRPRWVNLVGLAHRLVAEHQVLTDRHELRLSASEERIIGLWDSDRVEQIIANLLSNAVKYSPNGGPIEVTVAADEREARVTVRDRGLGIPAADLPQIFDRYYRVPHHADAGILGTGLGLFSARYVAHRMGGRIEVESEEGSGSAFTLVLLREPAESADGFTRGDNAG